MEDGNELSMSCVVCFVPGISASMFRTRNERRSDDRAQRFPSSFMFNGICGGSGKTALNQSLGSMTFRERPTKGIQSKEAYDILGRTFGWIIIYSRLILSNKWRRSVKFVQELIHYSVKYDFDQIFYTDIYSAYLKIFYNLETIRNNFI